MALVLKLDNNYEVKLKLLVSEKRVKKFKSGATTS